MENQQDPSERSSETNNKSPRALGGSHRAVKPSVAAAAEQPDQRQRRLPSLVQLCRRTIVSNLERYPPEAFDIVDPVEWDELVRLRFESTRPKKHRGPGEQVSGSIDGRLVPVVSAKFLQIFEGANPHLAESIEADELLWKYCVEFKFRQGCLTRPAALHLPWPQLVERVKHMGEQLCDGEPSMVAPLSTVPMNIALLRDSGVGKLVKKAIKKCGAMFEDSVKERLRQLVATWMKVAEEGSKEQWLLLPATATLMI
jgi:TFIIS helical bundle-like domain